MSEDKLVPTVRTALAVASPGPWKLRPRDVADAVLVTHAVEWLTSLCERVGALTAETCDLTGRLDIARQERGIAETQVEALERERAKFVFDRR